ncbi:OmpH family outer membrane protein [Sphingomonas sp. GCM10030256]|uniref:OmpH family outer membrane protein n=1 Tax=Sphingomonas sp. GCM10030256 TaxID=3273427 RepID=UPI00361B580D
MNTKLCLAAVAAAATLLPTAALAQRTPAAVVAVVDTDRIASECTACRAAATQLQSQQASLRSRAQTLQQQLQAQAQPIQTAVNALAGKQPDAALRQRITALETAQRNAQQELARAEQNLQSSQLNVNRQIGGRLSTIVGSVAAARGANIAVDKGNTIYAAPAVEITNEVLAQLNQQLPSVSVTPLPQNQQQRPQGR